MRPCECPHWRKNSRKPAAIHRSENSSRKLLTSYWNVFGMRQSSSIVRSLPTASPGSVKGWLRRPPANNVVEAQRHRSGVKWTDRPTSSRDCNSDHQKGGPAAHSRAFRRSGELARWEGPMAEFELI